MNEIAQDKRPVSFSSRCRQGWFASRSPFCGVGAGSADAPFTGPCPACQPAAAAPRRPRHRESLGDRGRGVSGRTAGWGGLGPREDGPGRSPPTRAPGPGGGQREGGSALPSLRGLGAGGGVGAGDCAWALLPC